ncbi:MAG: recombinase family protein [Gemmataceae bacterium]|nr:recombinase family protein [Gemmataceae bacterium]
MSKVISAVGYARRSTDKQEASIPDQQKAVERYAAEHGYSIPADRWYIDDAISGDDTAKRLDFQRMIADAQDKGDFKAILVWDQDRFGRFDSMEAGYWTFPLRQAGVKLVTVSDGVIDWDDFTGRVIYGLKQEGKHQFLQDLSRNVARGQLEAAKAGSWIGSAPYAYRIEGMKKDKRLILHEDDAAKAGIVKRIFREYVEQRRAMLNIADRLNAEGIASPGGNVGGWRFDTVRTILENPAYVGDYVGAKYSYGKYHTIRHGAVAKANGRCKRPQAEWIVVKDKHEALIDRQTFAEAQAILAKGKTGRSPHTPETNPYILSGKLRCGHCGATLVGIKGGKAKYRARNGKWKQYESRFRYYECGKRSYNGDDADKQGQTCPGTTVREDRVLHQIADHLREKFLQLDGKRLAWKADKKELTPKDLPKAFAKIKKLIAPPKQPTLDRQRAEKRDKAVTEQLERARRNLALLDPDNIPAAQETIRQLVAEHEELTLELRKAPPSEQDINAEATALLRSLHWLAFYFREAALEHAGHKSEDRPGEWVMEGAGDCAEVHKWLNGIEAITVSTKIGGKGTRRRHEFLGGEIEFRPVGGVTGNLNPHLTA